MLPLNRKLETVTFNPPSLTPPTEKTTTSLKAIALLDEIRKALELKLEAEAVWLSRPNVIEACKIHAETLDHFAHNFFKLQRALNASNLKNVIPKVLLYCKVLERVLKSYQQELKAIDQRNKAKQQKLKREKQEVTDQYLTQGLRNLEKLVLEKFPGPAGLLLIGCFRKNYLQIQTFFNGFEFYLGKNPEKSLSIFLQNDREMLEEFSKKSLDLVLQAFALSGQMNLEALQEHRKKFTHAACTYCRMCSLDQQPAIDAARETALLNALEEAYKALSLVDLEEPVEKRTPFDDCELYDDLGPSEVVESCSEDEEEITTSDPDDLSSEESQKPPPLEHVSYPLPKNLSEGLNSCLHLFSFPKSSSNPSREWLSHLLLAFQGIERFSKALENGDRKRIEAIFPTLLLDFHLQVEQLATVSLLKLKRSPCKGHSLEKRLSDTLLWEKLPPALQRGIKAIDLGTIWSRYPHASLFRAGQNPPEGLALLGATAKTEQLIKFICSTQYQILQLACLCHGIDHPAIDLFKPSGWLEEQWLAHISNLKEKPVTTDPLFLELDHQLVRLETKHPAMKAVFSDVKHHLNRLQHNLEEGATPTPQAWDCRNLMNIQWVIEKLYMARYQLESGKELYLHDFRLFQALLGDLYNPLAPHDKVLEFNWGTTFFYPWKNRSPKMDTFRKALEYDHLHFALSEGFAPHKKRMTHQNPSAHLFPILRERLTNAINLSIQLAKMI